MVRAQTIAVCRRIESYSNWIRSAAREFCDATTGANAMGATTGATIAVNAGISATLRDCFRASRRMQRGPPFSAQP